MCGLSFKICVAICVGGLFTVAGSLFVIFWPEVFSRSLQNKLILSPTATSFRMWEVTPIPVYIEFYFFNWTNPEGFRKLENDSEEMETGEKNYSKPILVELGPYVFREFKKKVIDSWNRNNSTVTFRQNKTWIFEPSMSRGNLDDLVQTINIPAVCSAFACRDFDPLMKVFLDQTMQLMDTNYYVKKKVREFLFEGYEDPLLDLASAVPESLVSSVPMDKFGWFYKRNNSADADGIFNMQTGSDDIQNLGKLSQWNYSNRTKMFESHCGLVNGSAGELYPPGRDRTEISFFSPDICRSLTLKYKEDVNFKGIDGYRFAGDERLFSNTTQCADNWCWCPSGECPPQGAIDVSTCKAGSPSFVSFPHFLHADPSYRDAVVGMDPHIEKHQMFVDLEPNTGIPFRVSAAFQINILIQPQEGFLLFNDMPKIYFPVIWFRQIAQIDDNLSPQLKLLIAIPTIGIIMSYILLSVGIVILILTVTRVVTNNNKPSRKQETQEAFPNQVFKPLIHSPASMQTVVL